MTRKSGRGRHHSLSQETLKSTLILSVLMFKGLRKARLDLVQLMALACKHTHFVSFIKALSLSAGRANH